MFYCLVVTELHGSNGSPNGLPALAAWLATLFLAASIALWVLADARRRHRAVSYDFGSFVFFLAPLVAAIYLFQTRGWRALTPIGWFLILYFAAYLISVVHWLFVLRR